MFDWGTMWENLKRGVSGEGSVAGDFFSKYLTFGDQRPNQGTWYDPLPDGRGKFHGAGGVGFDGAPGGFGGGGMIRLSFEENGNLILEWGFRTGQRFSEGLLDGRLLRRGTVD